MNNLPERGEIERTVVFSVAILWPNNLHLLTYVPNHHLFSFLALYVLVTHSKTTWWLKFQPILTKNIWICQIGWKISPEFAAQNLQKIHIPKMFETPTSKGGVRQPPTNPQTGNPQKFKGYPPWN